MNLDYPGTLVRGKWKRTCTAHDRKLSHASHGPVIAIAAVIAALTLASSSVAQAPVTTGLWRHSRMAAARWPTAQSERTRFTERWTRA